MENSLPKDLELSSGVFPGPGMWGIVLSAINVGKAEPLGIRDIWELLSPLFLKAAFGSLPGPMDLHGLGSDFSDISRTRGRLWKGFSRSS